MSISLAVVEDDVAMCDTIALHLKHSATIHLAGIYHNAEDALADIVRCNPEVLLMDIYLPGMDGVECTRRIKLLLPEVKILIFTGNERDERVFESMLVGASGYVEKSFGFHGIMSALQYLACGGVPMPKSVADKICDYIKTINDNAQKENIFTKQERNILEYLSKNYTYKEISEKLNVSIPTVSVHSHNIYTKLHVHSREEAIKKLASKKL